MAMGIQTLSDIIEMYKTINKYFFLADFSLKVVPTKFEKNAQMPNGRQHNDTKSNNRALKQTYIN